MVVILCATSILGLVAVSRTGWVSSPLAVDRPPYALARCRHVRMQDAPPKRRHRVRMQGSSGGFDQNMFDSYANPESFKGTSLTITEYPNTVLRGVGTEITEFDDKLAKLCEEMFTIMYAANGVGLAAPQVGLGLQLFVYNTDPRSPLKKMREVSAAAT